MRTLLTPNRLHNSCTTSLVKARSLSIIRCSGGGSTKDVKVVVVQDTGHSVSSHILCHKGQRVVISAHNKRLVDEIFLKVVCNSPLKCEELGLARMIVPLSIGQRSTPIGNRMQLSILPFLEQDCSQPVG